MADTNGSGKGKARTDEQPKEVPPTPPELTCGIIMPISAIDGLPADHWTEVKSIISEAVESVTAFKFMPRLVSDADEIGVIQKRIIQNVYSSSIVVCDVSAKNANVMFELGLRLAFDKPAVIIKDDKTDYSFDTGVIEHLSYPRDLRFSRIVEFKKKLAEKIANTYKASIDDPHHSPFLKSFGQFNVASLAQTEASPEKVMFEMLVELQSDIHFLKNRIGRNVPQRLSPPDTDDQKTLLMNNLLKDTVEYCQQRNLTPTAELLADTQFTSAVLNSIAARFGSNFTAEDVRAALRTASRIIETQAK